MMTLHKLNAGDGYTYLTRQVASGDHERSPGHDMADYYTAVGAPPGRWMGHGAEVLGVSGHVQERQMLALFGEGLHPDADQIIAARIPQVIKAGASAEEAVKASTDAARLGRRFYRTQARDGAPARAAVAGFDLVFTPVKSVSVLWALGDQATRAGVEAAHEAAVTRALGWLEEHVAYTRTGTNGVAQIDTDGLTVAAFDHRDSRSGEPNLHTHAAVSTKVRGVDGRWRSLDARVLHSAAVAASELYNTAIEQEMAARLGVTFTPRGGTAAGSAGGSAGGSGGQQVRASRGQREVREITGVDTALLEVFSSRRAMIEASTAVLEDDYRATHGHEPPRAARLAMAQQATLATRTAKAEPRSLAEQRSDWLRTATTVLGLAPRTPVRLVEMIVTQQARPHTVGADHPDPTSSRDRIADQSLIQSLAQDGAAPTLPVSSTGRVVAGDRDPPALRPIRLPTGHVMWLDELEVGLYQPPTSAPQVSTPPDRDGAGPLPGAPQTAAAAVWSGPTPEQIAAVVLATVETQRTTWTRWTLTAEAQRRIRRLHPVLATAASDRALQPGEPGQAEPAESSVIDADAAAQHARETLAAQEQALIQRVVHAAIEQSLPMSPPSLNPHSPTELTRRDGTSVFTVAGAERFSTVRILDAEEELLRAAGTTTTTTAPATAGDLYAVLAARNAAGRPQDHRPHPAQIELARVFATSTDLLEAGIGPAGTGKTTAMSLMAETVSRAGHRVLALAPSAAAAAVLGAELGVHAETLHKFLHTHARAESVQRAQGLGGLALSPGDVVLVDEAGMAGTLMLRDLVRIAARDGAVVRLLGDPQQLAAVESGGALRLLEHAGHTTSLTQVHRFTDPAEAAASLLVRAGKQHAVAFYVDHDRLHGGTAEQMQQAAYAAWRADLSAGRTTLLLAGAAATVTELNERARADLIAAGAIPDPSTAAEEGAPGAAAAGAGAAAGVQPGPARRVEVDLHDGNRASLGDVVVTRRNARHLATHAGRDFVKNGDVWTVRSVGEDGCLRVAHRDHHGHLTLPAAYVAEHVELAYACTVHRAQGMTVDTAHLLMDEGATTREGLYVALTRGRIANHVYAVTESAHAAAGTHGHHPVPATTVPERTAAEVFAAAVAAESAERPAHEVLRTAQDQATSLATLVPQYLYGTGIADELRYGVSSTAQAVLAAHAQAAPAPGTAPAPALASTLVLPPQLAPDEAREHTAWPQLTRALADIARAGEDPAQVMHQLLRDGFQGARDPFLVLVARAQRAAEAYPAPLPHPSAAPAGQRAEQVPALSVERAPGLQGAPQVDVERGMPSWLPTPPPPAPFGQGQDLWPHRVSSVGEPVRGGSALSGQPTTLDGWLTEHAELITARLDHLTDLTTSSRPSWAELLLPPNAPPGITLVSGSADGRPAAGGVRLLREVLAWRDQHQITDPEHALGARPGTAVDAKTWDRLDLDLRAQKGAAVRTTGPIDQQSTEVTTSGQAIRPAVVEVQRGEAHGGRSSREQQHPIWDRPFSRDEPGRER